MPLDVHFGNAPALGDLLLRTIDGGAALVVIDLTRTRLCAAAGVNALARSIDHAARRGVALDIVAVDGELVARVLAICGVPHRVIPPPFDLPDDGLGLGL